MNIKHSSLQQGKAGPRLTILALCAALACASPAVFAQSGADAVTSQRAAPFWQSSGVSAQAAQARTAAARTPALQLTRMHAATLDLAGMRSFAAGAPAEKAGVSLRALQSDSLTIALPHPDGGFRRFSLAEAPVMEDGLAAQHPDIKTYRGVGIDDPKATLRMDITPLACTRRYARQAAASLSIRITKATPASTPATAAATWSTSTARSAKVRWATRT